MIHIADMPLDGASHKSNTSDRTFMISIFLAPVFLLAQVVC